ncbi:hypothetical protein X560_1864 [Listeria fleischmannii 1991]|uniref:DUF4064 domain-containing protein n=2 Tax=Listeria fleischmannii TaxID=1069827 RepID=A0A2X3H8U5_9LIST|nr:DUF4064 domain-containing protein [Listeria fleischmannii]EMG29225.1 hypothetical protein LFLEISCH_01200 [Listeria fleischmannii subsp. fleischmannii LU2006-1]KMT58828.1 hypothetical protein X560_1864 [Listeria fleischmannii 1991]SQC70966.1 Uncharacterised protein [Listeria fleischmannii subsp. fleischmannii]
MIKRTGEVTLAIIGLILSLILQGIMTFIGFAFVKATNTQSGYDAFIENYERTLRESGISAADAPTGTKVIDTLGNFSTFFLIALIAVIILAVLGLIFIVGNKKPVLAGFLFLFAGLFVIASTFLVGFIPALLFIIAAIMCWVRKPKVTHFDSF